MGTEDQPGIAQAAPQPADLPGANLEIAVLRTLLYADIFDYPLTPREIHHFLIAAPATPDSVTARLDQSPLLAERTVRVNGYVTLRDRQAIADLRDQRRQSSERLWQQARRWGRRLGCLPFVRMVAVTGALAVDNAPANDDIDFLIVTRPGRVWLTRALAVVVVRAARLAGVGLCPNYVLSSSALSEQQRDLYVAHDLVQMVPLVGLDAYAAMRAANAWTFEFLPQAAGPLRAEPDLAPRGWQAALQAAAERLLGGRLGSALERWERERKLRKFAGPAARPGSTAELDAERVKGHFDDHGHPILREYQARLTRYPDLAEPPGRPAA